MVHSSSMLSDLDSEDDHKHGEGCKDHDHKPESSGNVMTGKIRGLIHKNKCFDLFQKTKTSLNLPLFLIRKSGWNNLSNR